MSTGIERERTFQAENTTNVLGEGMEQSLTQGQAEQRASESRRLRERIYVAQPTGTPCMRSTEGR